MATPETYRFLRTPGNRSALTVLLALMAGSALTEGLGLVLLAPMLDALASSGGHAAMAPNPAGTPISSWLERLGVPIALGPLLTMFVLLVIVRALVGYARTVAGQRFEMRIVDGLRARAWQGLLHCDWRTLSAMRRGESASLLITNIDRVGFGISRVLAALATAITLAGVGLAALALAPLVALAAGMCGAVVLFAYRSMRRRAAALGEALGTAYEDVYTRFSEGLAAMRVIKSFGREDESARRGAAAIAALREAEMAYIHNSSRATVALQGGGALLLAVVVWLAMTRWNARIETILPLVALFARALPLLADLQRAWQDWAHARPALDATMQLVDTVEAAHEPAPDAAALPPRLAGEITLSGVAVRFADRARAALDSIDLTIPAGSVMALTGPSGAGKSTLADILGGLIAPDAGTVTVDGIALDGGMRRAWRRCVAYVQQEPVLFTGTIRDNLLWAAPDADETDLRDALDRASAGFVTALPHGIDTRVGEAGHHLSGGERQRIVLARALLRDPAMLILDEAASALDAANEAAIADAIGRLRGRLTIVIIGHRGPLAGLADRVIAIDHGRIAAVQG